jgi:hypothetical protein
MATKKQQRRREKLRRHEYEEIWVDEEGREIEPPPDAAGHSQPRGPKTQPQAKGRTTAARGGSGRAMRTVQPPSWERVLKRAAIFAPLMLAAVYFLQKKSDRNLGVALVQTAVLLGFFLPFSYLMDRMMYRTYLRRTGQPPADRAKKKP